MVSMLVSSVIDFRFQWGQIKDYKIGICCFSPKHAVVRSKSKYWLVPNQNNVSEWNDYYVYLRSVVSVS
jgi:hypothetical protein